MSNPTKKGVCDKHFSCQKGACNQVEYVDTETHLRKVKSKIKPYAIMIKVKKENVYPKAITMIDIITGRFEIVHYDDKRAITIANLIESSCLDRYPIPIEITYDQGK